MKTRILSITIMIAAAVAVMAFAYPSVIVKPVIAGQQQQKADSVFPGQVRKIFENSCFDCHSDLSSNQKALAKLDFSAWKDLTDAKKVGKMQDISDILTKGDMPPAKYITNHPDKALTKEQKDIIIKWATDESNKLMGQ